MTADNSSSMSLEERCKTASSDLTSLGRVSHRLAMTDEVKLPTVLALLLPRLLARIGTNHQKQQDLVVENKRTATAAIKQRRQLLQETLDKIHAKLVEMLGHIIKRVKHDTKCKLNCEAILELLVTKPKEQQQQKEELAEAAKIPASKEDNQSTQNDDNNNDKTKTTMNPNQQQMEQSPPQPVAKVDPFTLNLSLTFLTMGIPRCTIEEIESMLPSLLVLAGQHSGVQSISNPAKKHVSHQIIHLALRAIEMMVTSDNSLRTINSPGKSTATNHNNQQSKKKSNSTSSSALPLVGKPPPPPSGESVKRMELVRNAVQHETSTATGAAVYDLLLNALLYQSTGNSTMPPPGLSNAAHEALRGGASVTAKDWAAEMAPLVRLKDLKLALLDFIAPCRRWALFMDDNHNNGISSTTNTTADNADDGDATNSSWLGLSRTVALLVVATGDANLDVADRANSYLKAHLDSMRSRSEDDSGDGIKGDTSTTAALGNPIVLSTELLSLVLGQANAENSLQSSSSSSSSELLVLGISESKATTSDTTNAHRILVMSTKRRMASEKASYAIMNFISSKVLEENPHLMDTIGADKARSVGSLAIMAVNYHLSSVTSASTVRSTNNPILASAKLLNSLIVRFASFYDGFKAQSTNDTNNESDAKAILDLLGRSLSIACSVLTGASSPRSGIRASSSNSTSDGLISTRDACYGVVCALSRSTFAMTPEGLIFQCGSVSSSTSVSTKVPTSSLKSVSIETATLLFGCAANEHEKLRPRATAALDALLGSYCRVYQKKQEELEKTKNASPAATVQTPEPSNPWSQTSLLTATTDSADKAESTFNVGGLAKALLPLLWKASQSSQPKASRVAAARWSTDLMKILDLTNACHILCFLAGDADVTAASIAREGLGVGKKIGDDGDDGTVDTSESSATILPDFSDFCTILFLEDSDKSSLWRPRYHDFSFMGKTAALRFGLMCLLSDLYGGEDDAVNTYMIALGETLAWLGGRGRGSGREAIDLLDESSICWARCLSTSAYARSMIVAGKSPFDLDDMAALSVSASSSKARRFLSESCGWIYEDYSLWTSDKTDSTEWLQKCKLMQSLESCAQKLTAMQSNLHMAGEVHGSAFLGARCIRAFRLYEVDSKVQTDSDQQTVASCWKLASNIISALGKGTLHSDEVIGNACAKGIYIALSYIGDDAPILDKRLYVGATEVLVNLNASLRKYGNGDQTDPSRASHLIEATGMTLAATTSAAGYTSDEVKLGPARLQCVDALFQILGSSAFRKDPEIALITGEALANYADAFSPDGVVWTSAEGCSGVSDWPGDFDEDFANELPPHQQVLYLLLKRELNSSSPHKRTACATALLALAGRAARSVNRDSSLTRRLFVKEIIQHLRGVQLAFITLLAFPKSKQLARESCCLGLAACQGLASSTVLNDLNDRLLNAFGQTTNYGGSAMMESREQNAARRARETDSANTSLTESFGMDGEPGEVGGVSGMTEAALGAYREMASASMALGRPDILYNLMLLSVSHPLWLTSGPRDRYNSASLLGEKSVVRGKTTAAEIRTALRPHLSKLIPRLLRACNDPNPQTRQQMDTLWVGITGGGAESRQAITQHLLSTMDDLIADASNKLWRARVGACGALTDVIVGRSWDELGGGGPVLDDDDVLSATKGGSLLAGVRLLRLWRAAMRALDDVRGSVRESGETLARGVRSLTIRLCDPSSIEKTIEGSTIKITPESRAKAEKEATAAASTALRWLVKNGLNQPCAEATGACVSTLLGVVDVVRPVILEPVLPDLINALLMAMSGLEPAALNYLQVRTAGQESNGETGGGAYDRLERLRLQMVQSGPIATALNKCLDMMGSVQLECQKGVIPHLDSAIRTGAGFATRAAAADAVSSLCNTCPNAFKFPGQSSTNPTVRLLRALYFASERERGLGARDKMAHALGNLAALSPGPSVRALALRACERYNGATGNNDDPAARRAAAAALRALACRSTSQFSDGGSNDVWCRRVLPIAFLGQKDSDAKVASLWKEVWDEGGSAANTSSRRLHGGDSFGVLLQEKLLPYLVRASVEALDDVSWSRRVTGCAALIELANLNVLAPAPRSIDIASSQSNVQRARRRSQSSSMALTACVKLIMKSRIWVGKKDVVNACVKIASKWAAIRSTDADAYGWEKPTVTCPWAPIVVDPDHNLDDLFSNDQWFKAQHSASEGTTDILDASKDALDSSKDEEDSGGETKLDLEDCDKLLGDESPSPAIEDDAIDDSSKEQESNYLIYSGLCRALLHQGVPITSRSHVSSEEVLPYRAAALQGLSDLLASINVEDDVGSHQLQTLYITIAPTLIRVVDTEKHFKVEEDSKKEAPLIVAKSLNCLAAAMWKGFGTRGKDNEPTKIEAVPELVKMFSLTGGDKQPAWTVRESSLLASAILVGKCDLQPLRKHETVSTLLSCTAFALKDRKFWKVRFAGLKLLHNLVSRVGTTKETSAAFSIAGATADKDAELERQLVLEALLPHKEKILKLARTSLADSEATVTKLGTDVCAAIAWWP